MLIACFPQFVRNILGGPKKLVLGRLSKLISKLQENVQGQRAACRDGAEISQSWDAACELE